MDLYEKIDDILDQENTILPKKKDKILNISLCEDIFNRLTNLILDIEPNKLNNLQIEEVLNIINIIESININEEVGYAKKSASTKNFYSKKWYTKNKSKIKSRKEKFKKNGEEEKREKKKETMKKSNRTMIGRKKTRYHVRKKSDRHEEQRERVK